MSAGNDLSIVSGESRTQMDEHTKASGTSGIASKTTRETHTTIDARTAAGSSLSGDSVQMLAGHDLLVKGSDVVGTQDVRLAAGNNLTVTTAAEQRDESRMIQETKSGLSGTGGIGVSYGSNAQKSTTTTHTDSVRGSTVGSVQGNLTMQAGNDLLVHGSDAVAGKDLTLTGKNVTVSAAEQGLSQRDTYETRQSGLTLALSGVAGSALNTAVTAAKDSREESSGRLQALKGVQAALSGVQAAQATQPGAASQDNAIGVSLSYGSQQSKSETNLTQKTHQGSTLTAGNNLNVIASSGDINIQGSQLQAGNDVLLNASRDINLTSSQDTERSRGTNSSSGGSVGVGIGAGSGGWGINVSASINKGSGHENSDSLAHNETQVTAGNRVTLVSGRDTTLTGAQVSGESVKADVGRNLTLTSEQDSATYDAQQKNTSAGASFNFGSMSGSASINMSKDKMHSDYQSVQEQTGLLAGKGGFDITVGEHTQLNGAVIGSTADADKNRLDTGTLGWSDKKNEAEYKVQHQSVGISTGDSIGNQFAGNMANGLLTGANNSGSADSTTKAAVSDGTIVIRDQHAQKQDVADLSRDVENANPGLGQIFDKEKEQNRLKEAQLIGQIGNQVGDIARTQGQIEATKAATDKMKDVTPEQLQAAKEDWSKANPGKTPTADDISSQAYQNFYNKAFTDSGFGTGGKVQQAIQAATAAVQGLAGGDLAKAIAGGSAPYIAEVIGSSGLDDSGKVLAHAAVNAALAAAQDNNPLVGAAGAGAGAAEMAGMIALNAYGKPVSELSESEKQTVSALATLAAGLAGGLAGNGTADVAAAAQAGQTTVANNLLGATSSEKLEKVVEKIKQGDRSLAAANKLIQLENADKRSDALVSKFTEDPAQMSSTERAELAGYLRVYASEMEQEYGSAVSQELVKGLLSGQDYIKRAPDSEAMSKAQSIMNTWGYHKSNASIGDAPMLFGGSVLGLTVKGMAANAAIGVGVNTGVQLAGKDPFSYVDAILAGVTAAATTGKGIIASAPINVGGAAIGSGIKGEEPLNSMAGAAAGTVIGGVGGEIIKGIGSKLGKDAASDLTGTVLGGYIGAKTGNAVKDELDKKDKTDAKK